MSEIVTVPANDLADMQRRIRELEQKLEDLRVYTDTVAEVCDEDLFQQIEAEYQLRKKTPQG